MTLLHEDRLFPADPSTRAVARRLFESIRDLPIVSPHGHTQASWFSRNQPFPDPATLFIQPDHYVHRMLYSQGIRLEELEIGVERIADPRKVWRIFAANYFLFRGTPTRLWLDYAFQELFGLTSRLSAETADLYFDTISARLETPEFRPRALYERFGIEVLATTDSALDTLADHAAIRSSGWSGRVLPTFRPDSVVDPEFAGFAANVVKLGEQTGEDTAAWSGYLAALRQARERFRELGAGRRPGAVSWADAHRDGADEPGGWAGDADSSRKFPQPQPPTFWEVWARHGGGYPVANRLCGVAEANAGPLRQ
jgi:glucuronate isomerase